ncbi:MAG TPA: S8 family serine peptidase [Candidatus Krumholzibacteria bacterium]|nr:S8 family serine peptidase [Candidatus Krumholzibacteria bacterium]HPD70801.1 S8 family serine peptidase [Candidatus Krumholzibacteria bacterium]HRY39499.1 S8 family serine peptidase [Candidatus Krumholzibacteria bacterium]
MSLRYVVQANHLIALAAILCAPAAASAAEAWNYLPNNDIGAVAWREAHPQWDGRGIVVAILDTGVDLFAPGMQTTSTGLVKVLDVRDFSGEGDGETEPAEWDTAAGVWQAEDGRRLKGAGALAVVPPAGGEVFIGAIRELQFRNNADVNDLNDDGDTGDVFAFLVWQAERAAVESALGVGRGYAQLQALGDAASKSVAEERASARVWLVAVDTDGDGDLGGEQVLRDYHVNYDSFGLRNPSAPDSRTLMAWSVNVRQDADFLGAPEPPVAEFHFDGGGHGSHCAGIAAGHKVWNQESLDGAAPGAFVISCKLGDNRLSGGATRTASMKKAYEHAVAFGERWGVPVVVNMSFGVASVEEGDDAMGRWLDELLADTPDVYVCTSAGNEGPGLSTIGLPATCESVISVGAYLSIATARDLYDARLGRDTMFAFSSRGGETPKPDVIAPGSALSTVPGFDDGSGRYNGTSMASPECAGAVALLLSAARQEGLTTHWGMVKRALIAGATRVDGLSLVDQGGGLVNVGASWPILVDLARSRSAHQVLWYRVETGCPFQDDGKASAAYWRVPGGAPVAPDRVEFAVTPIFHPDLSPDQRDSFLRSFSFKSDAGWLRLVTGKDYLRGDGPLTVSLQYDGKQLAEPGLYAARVVASLDGGDLGGPAAREFALWNTVVVGVPLTPENGYRATWSDRDLPPSWVHRYYVDVPAGASALRIRLEASEDTGAGEGARVLTEICDPEGRVRGGFAGYASPVSDPIRDMTVLAPELYPGTWEINVTSSITALDTGSYRLTASCDGYLTEPAALSTLERPGAGEPAKTALTVTRAFPGVFRGDVTAAVEGWRKERTETVAKSDEWTLPFTLDATTPVAEFSLTMAEKTANLFTDCAVNILDEDGRAIVQDSFDGAEARVTASLPEGSAQASFTLQVVGAFAVAADMEEWSFEIEERYRFASAVAGTIEGAGAGPVRLYCGVPAKLELRFRDPWPAAPEGMAYFGGVRFLDRETSDKRPGDTAGRLVLEVPIATE